MIQRLDCSKCGINQADTERPLIALPMVFICHDCYKKQKSLEQIIYELKAILVYCNTISRENNRGIIKLLVREEIRDRVKRVLEGLE